MPDCCRRLLPTRAVVVRHLRPGGRGATADQSGCAVPGVGEHPADRPCGRLGDLRPDHRPSRHTHRGGPQAADHLSAAPAAAVAVAAGAGAVRPGLPVLGRRRRLRPGLPRPRTGAAGAGLGPAAGRAGRPDRVPTAGPSPAAVGALRHLRTHFRAHRRTHQDSPRGHRRHLRRRADRAAARPHPGCAHAGAGGSCGLDHQGSATGTVGDAVPRIARPAALPVARPARGPHRGAQPGGEPARRGARSGPVGPTGRTGRGAAAG